MEIRNQLGVGHGDDEAPGRDAADFAEKGAGLSDVFKDFDTEAGVERIIGKRQAGAVDLGVRQTGGGHGGAIGGLHLRTVPIVAGGAELSPVPAEAAADIKDAARGRAEVALSERKHLAAADRERRARAVDVLAVVQRDELRREKDAEGILAVILVDHVDGMIGQNDRRTAIAEMH